MSKYYTILPALRTMIKQVSDIKETMTDILITLLESSLCKNKPDSLVFSELINLDPSSCQAASGLFTNTNIDNIKTYIRTSLAKHTDGIINKIEQQDQYKINQLSK